MLAIPINKGVASISLSGARTHTPERTHTHTREGADDYPTPPPMIRGCACLSLAGLGVRYATRPARFAPSSSVRGSPAVPSATLRGQRGSPCRSLATLGRTPVSGAERHPNARFIIYRTGKSPRSRYSPGFATGRRQLAPCGRKSLHPLRYAWP